MEFGSVRPALVACVIAILACVSTTSEGETPRPQTARALDERARVERDPTKRRELEAKASALYPAACDRGDGAACTELGMNRERWPTAWRSRFERDELERELALLEKGCRLGQAFACSEAGRLYDPSVYADNGDVDGKSIFEKIGRNVNAAIALYRRALRLYELGRASPACYELTLWYGYGLDWRSDVRDLDACCTGGFAPACLHAGLAFERGDGVKADPRRARRAYERDCSTGIENSCGALARTYERGLGGPKKLERAHELYQAACEFGDPGACKALSAMYREGRGVARSDEQATELAARRTELCKTPPELCRRHPDACERQRIRRDCESQ
jgi:TPR repeat protein